MKRPLLALCVAWLIAAGNGICAGVDLYTSTRSVTGFAVAKDGTLWAATRGGALHKLADGSWKKITQLDGLPSNEILQIAAEGDSVKVRFEGKAAVLADGKWRVDPSAANLKEPICSCVWQGRLCTATLSDLKIKEGEKWRSVALPKSTGTHISALLPVGDTLWAAMFGEGIWKFDGKAWSVAKVGLPDGAREITAMAQVGRVVVIGTRRDGIWEYDGSTWKQRLQPDEPFNTNCQNAASFKGMIFFSTLEDGLVVHTVDGWKHFKSPEISSDVPRQMVEFGGALYVRHGSGKVDRFDGKVWQRDVFANLPRKQVSALSADANKLYAAQWGGWSEYDGKTWEHHLIIPEIQGYPITAILADEGRLWVGTQGRGLAEIERASDKVKWHDERNGLPDDWVKWVVICGKRVYAGTFVGGLAYLDGTLWKTVPEIAYGEVTDMISQPNNALLAATRKGVWSISGDGNATLIAQPPMPVNLDAQALCADADGVWIGTRTGIWMVRKRSGE